MHDLNQKFPLQKYLIRYDQPIMEALREFSFFDKKEFYCLNQLLMAKRATKFTEHTNRRKGYLRYFKFLLKRC